MYFIDWKLGNLTTWFPRLFQSCSRERTKNMLCCWLLGRGFWGWGFTTNPSGSLYFFFFWGNSTRPRLCHLIFQRRRIRGRAPPRPPAQSSGISQEHQVGQQDAGPQWAGGLQAAHPHRSRPSLACLPIHMRERWRACVCACTRICVSLLELVHTHTRSCAHKEAAEHKQWPAFLYFDSYPKTTPKFHLIFIFFSLSFFSSPYFRASGYGLSIKYEDRRREM